MVTSRLGLSRNRRRHSRDTALARDSKEVRRCHRNQASQGAPAQVETTVAHEVGHFLKLFHTSEQSFTGIHDPLPDTPDNDASYLMFNTGEGNRLSPWQGRVMRSNPWVRH